MVKKPKRVSLNLICVHGHDFILKSDIRINSVGAGFQAICPTCGAIAPVKNAAVAKFLDLDESSTKVQILAALGWGSGCIAAYEESYGMGRFKEDGPAEDKPVEDKPVEDKTTKLPEKSKTTLETKRFVLKYKTIEEFAPAFIEKYGNDVINDGHLYGHVFGLWAHRARYEFQVQQYDQEQARQAALAAEPACEDEPVEVVDHPVPKTVRRGESLPDEGILLNKILTENQVQTKIMEEQLELFKKLAARGKVV